MDDSELQQQLKAITAALAGITPIFADLTALRERVATLEATVAALNAAHAKTVEFVESHEEVFRAALKRYGTQPAAPKTVN